MIRITARPLSDSFDDEAVERLRAHPGFLSAARGMAVETLKQFHASEPHGRQMMQDVGTTALCMTIVVLDAMPSGASVKQLVDSAKANRTSSPGRVKEFVEMAQAVGDLEIPAGADHWTHRRLILKRSFLNRVNDRIFLSYRAARRLDPTLPTPNWISRQARMKQILISLGFLIALNKEFYQGSRASTGWLVERKVGLLVLYRMIAEQPVGADRLLVSAPVSRAELAKEFQVSRAHISQLLAQAAELGALTFETPNRAAFAPEFSNDVERLLARNIQLGRLAVKNTAELARQSI